MSESQRGIVDNSLIFSCVMYMDKASVLSFTSRYTGITYKAHDLDGIAYQNMNFKSMKEWIKYIYLQEELTIGCFIRKNMGNSAELMNCMDKIKRKLDIHSDIDGDTQLKLSKSVMSPYFVDNYRFRV